MSDSNTNSVPSTGNDTAAGAAAPATAADNSSGMAAATASGASPLYPELPSPTAAQVERAKLEAGWRSDLARLEYEIETLRTVLNAKINQASELKRKLGITPITEIKQDLQQGLQAIKGSDAYQKTESALKTFGDFASRKLSDLRNSNAFKSVEGKVGSAYQSVKARSPTADDGFTDVMAPNSGLTTSTSLSSGISSSATMSSTPIDSRAGGGDGAAIAPEKPAEEKPAEKGPTAPQ